MNQMLVRILFVLFTCCNVSLFGQAPSFQSERIGLDTGPIGLLQSKMVLDQIGFENRNRLLLENWTKRWDLEVLQETDRRMNDMIQLGHVANFLDVHESVRRDRLGVAYSELTQILSTVEISRLKQIDAQVNGIELLLDSRQTSPIAWTNEQKEMFESIRTQMSIELASLRLEMGLESSEGLTLEKSELYLKKQKRIRDKALARVIRSMSEKQREEYNELCGKVVNVLAIQKSILEKTVKFANG